MATFFAFDPASGFRHHFAGGTLEDLKEFPVRKGRGLLIEQFLISLLQLLDAHRFGTFIQVEFMLIVVPRLYGLLTQRGSLSCLDDEFSVMKRLQCHSLIDVLSGEGYPVSRPIPTPRDGRPGLIHLGA